MSNYIMEVIMDADVCEKLDKVEYSTNPRTLLTVEDMIEYNTNRQRMVDRLKAIC